MTIHLEALLTTCEAWTIEGGFLRLGVNCHAVVGPGPRGEVEAKEQIAQERRNKVAWQCSCAFACCRLEVEGRTCLEFLQRLTTEHLLRLSSSSEHQTLVA